MPFDPLEAVGLVLSPATSPSPSPAYGSCFRFRHERVALTASHCVPDGTDVVLVFPRSGRAQAVEEIKRHPTADVAILITAPQASDTGHGHPAAAFWDRVANWGLGEEFMAYGYPAETTILDEPNALSPRLFVGHYQRFFDLATPRYRYLAGEMSIPAPAGMSGSPLFRRGAPVMVTGLVTTSVESYIVTDSIEDITEPGRAYRLETRKVLSYGVALMLSGVSDWLQSAIPPRDMPWLP